MSRISNEIVQQAKAYVLNLFDENLPIECVFHNGNHTLDVLSSSQIIGEAIELSKDDLNCLALGAIFHDIGYVKDYNNHEMVSARMAREYLDQFKVDEETISQVERAILATKVPQQPHDQISMALCDADLMHLTHSEYFKRIEPMREEWRLTGRYDLSEKEFHLQSIDFFKKHQYHTKYGREVLEQQKNLTLEKIKARILALD